MKKLYKLVLFSYLGPFAATFGVAVFVLMMQSIWKYIDDFVGKGLEWIVIMKLLFYMSITLVPMALPLAILLSSIMSFGNMSEHYELVAIKSAGISLQRIMRPLIVLSIGISGIAFYFSNVIMPYAMLKSGSLLYDVQHQRPALDIVSGVFYNGIDGYNIRVAEKDDNTNILKGVLIYDHTDGIGNIKVTAAEQGKMEFSSDNQYLIISLKNGYSYEEGRNINKRGMDTHPQFRTIFKEQVVRFDLSGFKLRRTDETMFKDNAQMMNIKQLNRQEDTLKRSYKVRSKELIVGLNNYFFFKRDSAKIKAVARYTFTNPDFIMNYSSAERTNIMDIALNQARNVKSYISASVEDLDHRSEIINKHKIEWHLKFTLSIACLVLFFIGAPLGAIIRKGGLGMPMVVSTALFLAFHILTTTGRKISQEGTWDVVYGMWLAPAVLFPVGAFLTYKAASDSALFDKEFYAKIFRNIFKRKK